MTPSANGSELGESARIVTSWKPSTLTPHWTLVGGVVSAICQVIFLHVGSAPPSLDPQKALHGRRQFRHLLLGLLPVLDGFPNTVLDMIVK